jgi:hypothetical protein
MNDIKTRKRPMILRNFSLFTKDVSELDFFWLCGFFSSSGFVWIFGFFRFILSVYQSDFCFDITIGKSTYYSAG